jgi:hypothetical protein
MHNRSTEQSVRMEVTTSERDEKVVRGTKSFAGCDGTSLQSSGCPKDLSGMPA